MTLLANITRALFWLAVGCILLAASLWTERPKWRQRDV